MEFGKEISLRPQLQITGECSALIRTAIQNVLGPGDFGNVTSAKLWVNCYETTTNGSPDVVIGKHSYPSEPSGSWNGETNADWGDYSTLHVPNQALGGYMITLNNSQITLSDRRTAVGGYCFKRCKPHK